MSRNLNKSVTLRLKVKPEDFIVEEIANIPIKKKGGGSAPIFSKRGDGIRLTSQKNSPKISTFLFQISPTEAEKIDMPLQHST